MLRSLLAPWQSHEGPDPELARTAIDASSITTRLDAPDSSDGRQNAAQESMRAMVGELKETEIVVAKTAVSLMSFYVMDALLIATPCSSYNALQSSSVKYLRRKTRFVIQTDSYCWFMCSLHCQRQSDGQDHGRRVM